MIGLIKKDLIVLKVTFLIYLALVVFYGVLGIKQGDPSFMQSFLTVFAALIPLTALSYDERSHWDKYALGMPVTRRQMVVSKYILGGLCMLVVFLLTSIMIFIMTVSKGQTMDTSILKSMLTVLGVGFGFIAINLPIMYKFGTEKGRFIFMGIFAMIFIIPMVFDMNGQEAFFQNIMKSGGAKWTLAGLLVYLVSLMISVRIYEAKEIA